MEHMNTKVLAAGIERMTFEKLAPVMRRDAVQVEWVATRPGYRGRGIGAALTWAATVARPDTPAVLVATDDGRPVYERLGYLSILRLAMWLRP